MLPTLRLPGAQVLLEQESRTRQQVGQLVALMPAALGMARPSSPLAGAADQLQRSGWTALRGMSSGLAYWTRLVPTPPPPVFIPSTLSKTTSPEPSPPWEFGLGLDDDL
ncbi:unnamed protein product [Rangifer tarandus platyrhynchus]|uniref:Uncharacterized protein n=1 Tax=Rangifer tarandus platyrhynchus TaxID=3082113 RepID=A0AC59Y8E3_RANTA